MKKQNKFKSQYNQPFLKHAKNVFDFKKFIKLNDKFKVHTFYSILQSLVRFSFIIIGLYFLYFFIYPYYIDVFDPAQLLEYTYWRPMNDVPMELILYDDTGPHHIDVPTLEEVPTAVEITKGRFEPIQKDVVSEIPNALEGVVDDSEDLNFLDTSLNFSNLKEVKLKQAESSFGTYLSFTNIPAWMFSSKVIYSWNRDYNGLRYRLRTRRFPAYDQSLWCWWVYWWANVLPMKSHLYFFDQTANFSKGKPGSKFSHFPYYRFESILGFPFIRKDHYFYQPLISRKIGIWFYEKLKKLKLQFQKKYLDNFLLRYLGYCWVVIRRLIILFLKPFLTRRRYRALLRFEGWRRAKYMRKTLRKIASVVRFFLHFRVSYSEFRLWAMVVFVLMLVTVLSDIIGEILEYDDFSFWYWCFVLLIFYNLYIFFLGTL